MIKAIAAIAGAIAALCGLLALLYRQYWSPIAKRKRQAVVDGHKAVDEGDTSAITSAFDKLRKKILPIIILLFLAGCNCPTTILHPIEAVDIIRIKQGENFEAPKDGYFISDRYLKDVMDCKVE